MDILDRVGYNKPGTSPLESRFLGSLIAKDDAILEVYDEFEYFTEKVFEGRVELSVFQAIYRLADEGKEVNSMTVSHLSGVDEKVLAGYVREHNEAGCKKPVTYAGMLYDNFIKRSATSILQEAISDVMTGKGLYKRISAVLGDLSSILDTGVTKYEKTAGEATKELMEELYRVRKMKLEGKDTEMTGLPTGLALVNKFFMGWQPKKLIVLAARTAMGKCLGIGTKIVMYDGSLKRVEDIVIGDLLMGPDSKPRKVLSLARGREMMYWVRQNKGINYRVNESHVLSIKKTATDGRGKKGDIVNISVLDYISKSDKFKHHHKGYKVGVSFEDNPTSIDPYFIGLWLGDGCGASARIHNPDVEIIDYLREYAAMTGRVFAKRTYSSSPNCPVMNIKGKGVDGFYIQSELRRLGLLEEKHIPDNYLVNSDKKRLELLAGLLDTDGYYDKKANLYEITVKQKRLAKQIKYLSDSLGFRTSFRVKKGVIKSLNFEGYYYRVRIWGNTDKIPCRVRRKISIGYNNKRDWRNTGIMIDKDIVDDYYGFEIDGDGLFLLEDFTVTHNTSLMVKFIFSAAKAGFPVGVFTLEMGSSELMERILSGEARVSTKRMRTADYSDDEMDAIDRNAKKIAELPIYFNEKGGSTAEEIKRYALKWHRVHNIKALFIDYIQIVRSLSKNKNRDVVLGEITSELKALSKNLDIPVIALAQVGRDVERRGGAKRPQLSDLRESGNIEQDSDIVMFIYRPEYYGINEDETGQSLKGVAELIVAKHRGGSIGTIKVGFKDELTDFYDLDENGYFPEPVNDREKNMNYEWSPPKASSQFPVPPEDVSVPRPAKMNDDDLVPF